MDDNKGERELLRKLVAMIVCIEVCKAGYKNSDYLPYEKGEGIEPR